MSSMAIAFFLNSQHYLDREYQKSVNRTLNTMISSGNLKYSVESRIVSTTTTNGEKKACLRQVLVYSMQ